MSSRSRGGAASQGGAALRGGSTASRGDVSHGSAETAPLVLPRGARLDLRLAVPAAAAWVAAGLVIAVPGVAAPLALGSWLAAGLAAALLARRAPAAVLVLAAIALVSTSTAVLAPTRAPVALVEAEAEGRGIVARLTIDESVPGTGAPFADATLTAWRLGEEWSTGAVPVVLFGELPPAPAGTVVETRAELVATEPGDAAAFLLFSRSPPSVVGDPTGLLAATNDLRAGLASRAADLGGDGGALLPGLALGDTSALPDDLDAAMRASSLTHLTAVSGANCAIVVGLVLLAGRALGAPRGLRVAASLVVLAGFVVLATPQPSVVRAAVMAAIALVAFGSGRPVRGVPVLALAVLTLLVLDPWLARDYGFVLSVLATGALLVLAGPLARAVERVLPSPIAVLVSVPLAAQLVCQPVIVLLEPALPVYGVVANLLAGPAAPAATVLGMAACLLLPVVPALGDALSFLAWLPAGWIAAVARFASALPGASLDWLPGWWGVGSLALLTATALVAVLCSGRPRRIAAAATLLAVAVALGAGTGSRLLRDAGRPADWQLAACEVGQGDAMLVRSAGAVALIDTGREPGPVADCLDSLGVARLDLLVLTHFDLDHVGGAADVLGRADVVLAGPPGETADERLLAAFAAAGSEVRQVRTGDRGLLGGLVWTVLWPTPASRIEPGNDASVTMRFDPSGPCASRCLSSLFLGDLGEEAQRGVLREADLDAVDVVKVSHHGSADQHPELYHDASAELGLIGVGPDNGYGHPAPSLLDLLASTGTAVARTDTQGLALVATDESGRIVLWTERGRAP